MIFDRYTLVALLLLMAICCFIGVTFREIKRELTPPSERTASTDDGTETLNGHTVYKTWYGDVRKLD
jgi:hypothetical protein